MKKHLIIILLIFLTSSLFSAKITIRNSFKYNVKIKVIQKRKTIYRGVVKNGNEIKISCKNGKIMIIYKFKNRKKKIIKYVKGKFMYFILN